MPLKLGQSEQHFLPQEASPSEMTERGLSLSLFGEPQPSPAELSDLQAQRDLVRAGQQWELHHR